MPPLTGRSTIAELLCPHLDKAYLAKLETFRLTWEAANGPCDLTRYYTSLWPVSQMEALCDINPKAYYDGLPPFLKDFIIQETRRAFESGTLDNISPMFQTLFLEGHLSRSSTAGKRLGR